MTKSTSIFSDTAMQRFKRTANSKTTNEIVKKILEDIINSAGKTKIKATPKKRPIYQYRGMV